MLKIIAILTYIFTAAKQGENWRPSEIDFLELIEIPRNRQPPPSIGKPNNIPCSSRSSEHIGKLKCFYSFSNTNQLRFFTGPNHVLSGSILYIPCHHVLTAIPLLQKTVSSQKPSDKQHPATPSISASSILTQSG